MMVIFKPRAKAKRFRAVQGTAEGFNRNWESRPARLRFSLTKHCLKCRVDSSQFCRVQHELLVSSWTQTTHKCILQVVSRTCLAPSVPQFPQEVTWSQRESLSELGR